MSIVNGQTITAADFILSSAGAGSSGQVAKLNGSGLIDDSFMSVPHYPNSSAFSSTAPTSMTTLDLSSIVGAKHRMVFIKIANNDGASSGTYIFRQNGDGTINASDAGGTTIATVVNGHIGYILVSTDASGIVQWMCSGARTTVLTVVAYL
jgi:hypothetical protein